MLAIMPKNLAAFGVGDLASVAGFVLGPDLERGVRRVAGDVGEEGLPALCTVRSSRIAWPKKTSVQ